MLLQQLHQKIVFLTYLPPCCLTDYEEDKMESTMSFFYRRRRLKPKYIIHYMKYYNFNKTVLPWINKISFIFVRKHMFFVYNFCVLVSAVKRNN